MSKKNKPTNKPVSIPKNIPDSRGNDLIKGQVPRMNNPPSPPPKDKK